MAENKSNIIIDGGRGTVELEGAIKAFNGGTIKITGKDFKGESISLHNYYHKGTDDPDDNPNYQNSAKNSLSIEADKISFKEYYTVDDLDKEDFSDDDVKRDTGCGVAYINNSNLTLEGDTVTITDNSVSDKLRDFGMVYYTLRGSDGAKITLGRDQNSNVNIAGDVLLDSYPFFDTEDRPDEDSIPKNGEDAKISTMTVKGTANITGDIMVMHDSVLTIDNANITGGVWNGVIPDEKNEKGLAYAGNKYYNSNVSFDGNLTPAGGSVTIKGGTISGTVFSNATLALNNVKVENGAITIGGGEARVIGLTVRILMLAMYSM